MINRNKKPCQEQKIIFLKEKKWINKFFGHVSPTLDDASDSLGHGGTEGS
jgi:hypothetical protein